jgi:predicted nucleotide modification protein, DUF1599 family
MSERCDSFYRTGVKAGADVEVFHCVLGDGHMELHRGENKVGTSGSWSHGGDFWPGVPATPGPLYTTYIPPAGSVPNWMLAPYGDERDNEPKLLAENFIGSVQSVLDEAGALLLKKHKDYGPKNISLSPGGPLNGLRVRMWDKLARINNLVDSGVEPENESLADSFIDLLNYSAIALLVLRDQWPAE